MKKYSIYNSNKNRKMPRNKFSTKYSKHTENLKVFWYDFKRYLQNEETHQAPGENQYFEDINSFQMSKFYTISNNF